MIVEALADHAPQSKDADFLTEMVRQRLARQITRSVRAPDNVLYAVGLGGRTEDVLRQSLARVDDTVQLAVDPGIAAVLLEQLNATQDAFELRDQAPMLLVAPDLRKPLRDLLERFVPQVHVMSFREVETSVEVRSLETIEAVDGNALTN